jgi:YD repeat-containing protein
VSWAGIRNSSGEEAGVHRLAGKAMPSDCTDNYGADQPIVTADPAGEQTSTVYDQNGNVTDTYGPVPG